MDKAVFLDRDGTLIPDLKYDFQLHNIQLLPGVADGLRVLKEAGYALVIITNQSGVAKGLFTEDNVREVHERLAEILAAEGAAIDSFQYCPHHIDGVIPEYAIDCACRKPQPGMILDAASLLALDLSRSWMIGDIDDDVEAGHKAGCQTVLINSMGMVEDNDSSAKEEHGPAPTYIASNFKEAVNLILNHRQSETYG